MYDVGQLRTSRTDDGANCTYSSSRRIVNSTTCRMQPQGPHLSTKESKVKRRRERITRAERTPSTTGGADLIETDILLRPKKTHNQLEIHR